MLQPVADTNLIITGGPESIAPTAHGKENASPVVVAVPAATGGAAASTGGGARGQEKAKETSSIFAGLAKERVRQEAANAAQLARMNGAGTKNTSSRRGQVCGVVLPFSREHFARASRFIH